MAKKRKGSAKMFRKNTKPRRSKRAGLTDLSNAVNRTLRIESNPDEDDTEKPEKEDVKKEQEKEDVKKEQEKEDVKKEPEKEDVVVIRTKSEEHSPERDNEKVSDSTNKENENPLDEEELALVSLPCPDYDADHDGDIYETTEYVADIFRYLYNRESFYHITDYMPQHPKFKKTCRASVVDWIVQCQDGFEMNHEVLYLAVKLFDHYLHATKNEEKFVDIGAASLVVAWKIDHQFPLTLADFNQLITITCAQMLNYYEREILTVLHGDIDYPISYRFLRHLSRLGEMDLPTLTLARYVLETSLLFYEFICVPDSLMAAATLLLASRMLNVGDWSKKLIKYSGYELKDVEPLMWRLNHMMKVCSTTYPKFVVIKNKYNQEIFYRSASIPLLPDKRPHNEAVGPPPCLSFNAAGSVLKQK